MKKVLAVIAGMLGVLLVSIGIITKAKKAVAISIIGGADGPTSIFLAGKVGNDFSIGMIVIGAILVGLTIICVLRKRKK